MKVRDVLKLLRKDGWSARVTVGSHRQLKHPPKARACYGVWPSIGRHSSKTLKSILTQAGLKK